MPLVDVTDPDVITRLNQLVKNEKPSTGAAGASMFPGIDASLQGEDYLAQFPAEIQTQVHDYVHGMSMPTGNPRRNNYVKQVASKYGADIGLPADDTNFRTRQAMRTDLTKNSPSSKGGQLTNGTTAMQHLTEVADAAKALHNSGGWGIAPVGHALNYLWSFGTDQAAKIEALQTAALRYGEEITKFYAGSPGGEHERERFLEALSGTKTPQELAAVIEQEMALIPAKMHQIHADVADVLGSSGPVPGIYTRTKADQDQYIHQIGQTLAEIRGGRATPAPGRAPGGAAAPGGTVTAPGPQNAPAASPGASAASAGVSEGTVIVNRQTGHRLIMRNGSWQELQ